MQYILTESEYAILQNHQRELKIKDTKKLQELCTKIADTMPVFREWDKQTPMHPWGCILSDKSPGYCDECPVKDICPCDAKEWSQ